MALKLRVSENVGNFLTHKGNVCFSRSIVFCGISYYCFISQNFISCVPPVVLSLMYFSVVKIMLPSFKKGLYTHICNLPLIIHGSADALDLRFHLSDCHAAWLRTMYYRE